MAAPTLNRSRPFGSITGDPLGRMYEQDNLFFMGDGSVYVEAVEPEILPHETPAPKPAAKKGKAATAAETPAQDAQLDAQLGAA